MPEPIAKRIRRERTPVPGESLRGLVADSCAASGMTSAWPVLRHAGMPHRNRVDVAESAHVDIGRLAFALRVNEDEVVSRLHPGVGASRRSVNGLAIPSSLIETRVRRFSPSAIASGILHHPVTHELRPLPFSTVGWDVLRSRCGCVEHGVLQGWTRTHGTARCDACGKPLSSIDPTPVPDAWHEALHVVADLAHHDEAVRLGAVATLPDPLGSTGASALFETLRLVADCLHAPTAESEQVAGLRRTEAMAHACEALLSWPNGLRGLEPAATTPPSRWDAARREYLALDFPADFASASARPSSRRSTPPAGTSAAPTGPISAMAAARLGHVDEPALKRAWDEGRFTKHVRVQGGERVRAFDPDEVLAVAPTLRRDAAIARAANALGMPVYGAEQLLAMALMIPGKPDGANNQAAMHLAAAAELTRKIKGLAVFELEDPVPFVEAVRHVSGRPKPWGPIVAALLAGDIAVALADEDSERPLTAALSISATDVAKVLTLTFDRSDHADFAFSPTCSQGDALECLNGYKNSVGPLDGLGTGGGRGKVYDWSDVEARAELGATTSDLARRFGLEPSRAFSLLDSAADHQRTSQIVPGLWERTSAERELRARIDERSSGWLFTEDETPATPGNGARPASKRRPTRTSRIPCPARSRARTRRHRERCARMVTRFEKERKS